MQRGNLGKESVCSISEDLGSCCMLADRPTVQQCVNVCVSVFAGLVWTSSPSVPSVDLSQHRAEDVVLSLMSFSFSLSFSGVCHYLCLPLALGAFGLVRLTGDGAVFNFSLMGEADLLLVLMVSAVMLDLQITHELRFILIYIVIYLLSYFFIISV